MKRLKVWTIVLAAAFSAALLGFLANAAIESRGTVASMTTSRYNCKVVAFGDRLLIFGGRSNVRNPARQVEEYDSARNSVNPTNARMDTLQHCFAAALAGDKVFLVGSDQKGSIEEYDPWQRVTTVKRASPVWRGDVGAAGLNGRVYVAGGFQNGKASAITEEYDPYLDSWVRKASMPTPRGGLSLVALNGRIYAIGGTNEHGGSRAVEEYDPAADKWQVRANMHYARTYFGATAVAGRILVLGGQPSSNEIAFLDSVEEYSPENDGWTEKDSLPYKLACMDAASLNGRVYVCGGLTLARSLKALVWPGDMGARQIMEYAIR